MPNQKREPKPATPSDLSASAELRSKEMLGFSLPREAAKAFNKMDANDWLEDDWRDLLTAHNWVLLRVAKRHGLLKPNAPGERPGDTQT